MNAVLHPAPAVSMNRVPANKQLCYATVVVQRVMVDVAYYMDGEAAVPVRVETLDSDVTPWFYFGMPSEEDLAEAVEESLGVVP